MIKAYVRYKGTWAHLNRPRSMRESFKERSDRDQMNCLYVPKNREAQTDGVGNIPLLWDMALGPTRATFIKVLGWGEGMLGTL